MSGETIWISADAKLATGGESTCEWKAMGVSIDSRKIEPGDLFIAIPGEKFDGHDFVKEALAKGAAAAVVGRIPKGVEKNAPLLIVEDVMKSLNDLARFSRERVKGKIIGVTGSVGKTSTKEMLALAFKGIGKVYFTEGNLNNHFGLPLSLARMSSNTDLGIFEIGMNHPGEITPLAKLAKPDVAIITTVEAVHLEFFESVEGIADAKAEIFCAMGEKNTVVLNIDNTHYNRLKDAAKRVGVKNITSFGSKHDADFCIDSYEEKAGNAIIKLSANGKIINYKLGITGRHHALNSAGVLAVVEAVGGDLDCAAGNLSEFSAKSGRGKIYNINHNGKNITIIDDCYNASPASVSAAVDNLGNMEVMGRKIVALGDMFELGKNAPELHKNLSKKLLENNIDLLFTAGNLTLNLYNAIPLEKRGGKAESSMLLGTILAKSLKTGDCVLVKGSRGMKMENVVKYLQENKEI